MNLFCGNLGTKKQRGEKKMSVSKKQKFFALNWYDKEIWVETCINNKSNAEKELARNNSQVIINENEAKKLLLYFIVEFLK